MSLVPFTRWSLRRQLTAFFILILGFIILAGGFAFWRIRGFDERRLNLLLLSRRLRYELKANFADTRSIGILRSHLRFYMNTGEAEDMRLVHADIEALRASLGQTCGAELNELESKIRILDVRMRSMRENTRSSFQAEEEIMALTTELMRAAGPEHHIRIRQLTADAYQRHHRLYVSFVLSGQAANIAEAQAEAEKLFKSVDEALIAMKAEFPPKAAELADTLRNAYYELDESISTITAIRIRTLETQDELLRILNRLESRIAEKTLAQSDKSLALMADILALAKNNIRLLYASLVTSAVFFFMVAYILNRGMIYPLVRFVDMLRGITPLLEGLRTRQVTKNEDYRELVRMADSGHNEISEVARSIRRLVSRLRALSLFRQAIEGDPDSRTVLRRLGQVFVEQIGLPSYCIHELREDHRDLELICLHPRELRDLLPPYRKKVLCRAWRTALPVSSIDTPGICDCGPAGEGGEYICVPMLVGNQAIAVVQFLLPEEWLSRMDRQAFVRGVEEASLYIAETLPILQSRQLARRLESQATQDPLTGLFNRRYLELTLDRISAGVKRRDSSVGILMCDVDHFKAVNDEFGHDAGDHVLRDMAQILQANTREMDLVIRYGGEEFLVILVDCTRDEAVERAEQIREAVAEWSFEIEGAVLGKTMSIGVSGYDAKGSITFREAIKMADAALYKAKEGGRNQVICCPRSFDRRWSEQGKNGKCPRGNGETSS